MKLYKAREVLEAVRNGVIKASELLTMPSYDGAEEMLGALAESFSSPNPELNDMGVVMFGLQGAVGLEKKLLHLGYQREGLHTIANVLSFPVLDQLKELTGVEIWDELTKEPQS